ncbi:hypothetical protein BOTCAL_0290g00120 [Botryotinia calthae]|uniref:SET domain-containing protein n=1 Tax=Botryotinia calthae TaxID=38488 RepID=A0A4Y8CXN2_9HELO|nr:hypothetical protein BOTCAL_0290g00120 [Botryotinia calthae]
MDIDNVSDISQYVQVLDQQRMALKAAMCRQGQHPKDMKSLLELIRGFMMHASLEKLYWPLRQNSNQLHTSFVASTYAPSTTPLDKLKPIQIKDLRLETHHRGSYLLVRASTPPTRMTAIMAIVEDENEDGIQLQLYQQPDERVRPATSVIMKNDVFLVKEPYFKTTSDGGYGLRVDHVSDITYLDAHHNLLPEKWKPTIIDISKTAGDWRQEGNDAMEKKQYWEAIKNYTAALKCSPSVHLAEIIRLNSALAYLRNGNLDAALTDTKCMVSLKDAPEKALYRAGQALYGLERFSECHDIFEHLCAKYPNNAAATTGLKRVSRRVKEQESGIYDFGSIYKELSATRPPHLDHATYVGPVVVKSSPGRGQGLFTTRAVKTGELLLCEKAFAHCYAGVSEDSGVHAKTTLLINVHTNRMMVGTQGDLITAIVQKLWKNPSLIPKFHALHRGSYKLAEETEVDGKPVIDTFLVEQIMALNVFGCPLSSFEGQSMEPAEVDKHHSCGIWILASKINHSCLSNARRSFLGDLQLVRATSDIPANTEITYWYKLPTGESDEMQNGLKHWGFQCKCIICTDSKDTPKKEITMRKKLLRNLNAVLNASHVAIPQAERLLNALEKTYKRPAIDIPRLALRESYFRLTRVYSQRGTTDKAVLTALRALESIGFVIKNASLPAMPGKNLEIAKWGLMLPGVIEAWIYLCSVYSALAPQYLQQAREYVKLAYKICIGEDHTFKQIHNV